MPVAAFLAGSPRIGSSAAATLSTVEPVVAVTIAVLFMGERLTVAMLCGGLMVMLAAVFLARQGGGEQGADSVPGDATRNR
ncbi:EamA-like transporter family protein [compost metagenome]